MTDQDYRLILGDCREGMASLEAASVDTIITDPPYGLKFMGKGWDHGVPGVEFWREALRVAKPGAMLMAFGGTRTHHRLMVAIEDAGWEIRDTLMWLYASGFPKSHDISKAIDREAGAEREVVGSKIGSPTYSLAPEREDGTRGNVYQYSTSGSSPEKECEITAPATDAARTWDGWGTALKPAWEPIILAMKPLDGTYAQNAIKHGVAGLWIDGARVPTNGEQITINTWDDGAKPFGGGAGHEYSGRSEDNGRWPANIIHDGSDVILDGFPDSPGQMADVKGTEESRIGDNGIYGKYGPHPPSTKRDDTGSAARFFYCAKVSSSERNAGLEGMEERSKYTGDPNSHGTQEMWGADKRPGKSPPRPAANHHPTVKPLALMRYLCRLTRTPTGGVVLDPFMGSGSTGCAALLERRRFIGIDIDPDYLNIAERRLAYWAQQVWLEDHELPIFTWQQ